MSVIVGNKKVRKVGVLTEPNTYDGNITSPDMQYGTIGYAQGKRIVGTGKAFEFAVYGKIKFSLFDDENGVERYGGKIDDVQDANILLLTHCKGDVLSQKNIIIHLEDLISENIGKNITTNSDLFVFQRNGKIYVYSVETNDKGSQFYYFIGKDNYL